jgi:hypothetical protein
LPIFVCVLVRCGKGGHFGWSSYQMVWDRIFSFLVCALSSAVLYRLFREFSFLSGLIKRDTKLLVCLFKGIRRFVPRVSFVRVQALVLYSPVESCGVRARHTQGVKEREGLYPWLRSTSLLIDTALCGRHRLISVPGVELASPYARFPHVCPHLLIALPCVSSFWVV